MAAMTEAPPRRTLKYQLETHLCHLTPAERSAGVR